MNKLVFLNTLDSLYLLNLLIFFTKLDGAKEIQSIKSACSVLHLELIACVLPLLDGNDKGYRGTVLDNGGVIMGHSVGVQQPLSRYYF